MNRKQIFRIGIKNFPAAHGGVEAATYNFVQATKDRYDFTIFTVWDNPTVKNNEVDGVRVYQLAKGWLGRFRQIRMAVKDKKNTVLHFHMEIFIPLAIVFSLLGYNVVSSIHGLSWHNPKISPIVQKMIVIVDILGINLVKRMIFVSKYDYDIMRRFTFRKYYLIPNGSKECRDINKNPEKDIIYVGRLSIHKDIIGIIQAADRDKRHVDLYGPFDEREVAYVEKVRKLFYTSQYAKYCGILKPENIYKTMGQYKAAVNASPAEASPNAVIEAGACGLFLYLSDIPGHRNLDFPDVYYFSNGAVSLPVIDGSDKRSLKNIEHHKNNLTIEMQINRYSEVYESFTKGSGML